MELGKLAEARAAYVKNRPQCSGCRGQAALEHRAGNQPAAEKAFGQLVSEVGDAAMYQQPK